MCKKLIYLTFFFAFCTTAMGSEIAISTQANWWTQAAADREMQEIVNNVKGVSIQRFTSTQHAALATWVRDHTGDHVSDLLILCGQFPDTIYAAGNAQPDGSLAELFLDDGNTIINTGDWIFYVVNSSGANGPGGLQNMMDISGVTVAGADNTPCVVTAEGQEFTPSLYNRESDRPFHLDTLAGDWEAELILAQATGGTLADPVIVHNTVTDGRIGIFFEVADTDTDLRGEVISQWINNWWLKYVYEANPYARNPNPPNGSQTVLQPLLQWKAGDTAAQHDVYFGTNPTPGQAEFKVRQAVNYTIYYDPFPLTPGTTYYWRIDEIEADGTTIHTGNVWTFTSPSLKAWVPNPADGAKWVPGDVTLSWNAGWNSVMYKVYLSANLDAVTNGTAEADKGTVGTPAYDATGLALDTTYYWRVDAFDNKNAWHTGDVWSFATLSAMAGVKAEYYHHPGTTPPSPPQSAFQTLVLTRVDPAINFNWGDGSPDPSVNVDDFAVKWVCELEVPVSDTYTFWTNTDDGVMMWFDGQLVIDNWTDHGTTLDSSPAMALTAGSSHSIEMWWYERGGGAVAELHWSTPTMSRQPIPAGPLLLPLKASRPNPPSGAVDVKDAPTLRWSAGENAAKHNVYFGTDANAVADATTATAGIYRGQQNLDVASYTPTEAPLAWDTTYYWRIDEVNGVDVWKGSVWSFTTANFIVVDSFEDYDDYCNRIFYTWTDGWGYSADPTCGVAAYGGNGTGSTVGNLAAPFAEQTIVHSGGQSMPFEYNNSGTGGKARYSEAQRQWASPQDWTRNNVKVLTLYFYGTAANAAERLYVAVEDSAGQVKVVNHPDVEAVQREVWQEWNIELTQFAPVNVKMVKKMYIGVGNRVTPTAGGSGKIYIDDIRVYPSRCVASMLKPDADIARPYDCKVDYKDLRVLAYEWLSAAQLQNWQERVAYWDSRYRTNWAGQADSVAVRDGLAAAGYTILNADQLKTWMNARIADKKLSVVVFCRDNAPDTVVESVDATCTLRKYLDAGGKIVFYADIPFYDIAHADGTWDNPQTAGASAILGFDNTVVLWDSNTQVALTTDGIAWGLTQTWASVRPIAATDVTVLATDAAGNAAAWVRHYLPGDTYRGFVRLWDRGGRPPVEDIIRAAEYGALAADLNADTKVDFKDYAKLADAWLDEVLWP
jgi:hypothetical protein